MQPLSELGELYEEWRTLTEAEGQAIEGAEWGRVQSAQAAKEGLIARVMEAEKGLQAVLARDGPANAAARRRLAPVVQGLAEAERRNAFRIEAARAKARDENEEIQGTMNCLRRVQGAYAGTGATPSWQFYS